MHQLGRKLRASTATSTYFCTIQVICQQNVKQQADGEEKNMEAKACQARLLHNAHIPRATSRWFHNAHAPFSLSKRRLRRKPRQMMWECWAPTRSSTEDVRTRLLTAMFGLTVVAIASAGARGALVRPATSERTCHLIKATGHSFATLHACGFGR